MKKIRTYFHEMKESFLTAKFENYTNAILFTTRLLILAIFLIAYWISVAVFFIFKPVGICMLVISVILPFFLTYNDKYFGKLIPISYKILFHFFGKYGKVVTREDWNRIKKLNPKAYKDIWSKDAIGYCYWYSWLIALYIDNAKLMYCSTSSGGHSVIVKNNCVYDTNTRMHYDYDEYINLYGVTVYKIFEKKDYQKKNFFDEIREDFVRWCNEHDFYCEPQ